MHLIQLPSYLTFTLSLQLFQAPLFRLSAELQVAIFVGWNGLRMCKEVFRLASLAGFVRSFVEMEMDSILYAAVSEAGGQSGTQWR